MENGLIRSQPPWRREIVHPFSPEFEKIEARAGRYMFEQMPGAG